MDIPFVTFENMHKEIKEEALEKFKKIYDKGWLDERGTAAANSST